MVSPGMGIAMTKILLVDDESRLLRSLRFFFEDEGYEVFTASTGEEALLLLAQTPLDACVVDMRLPGIDGNEVIRQAYAKRLLKRFIIHTGSTDYRVPQDLLHLGISQDHVFHKPVPDLTILVQAVETILEDKQ